MRLRVLVIFVFSLRPALAQADWPQPRPILVSGSLDLPVDIQSAHDGSGRLFVVEQRGRIRILKNGTLQGGAFLDIGGKVACCSETGLLGLAFPPDFSSKQYFYVNYTERSPNLRTVIARYRVRGINPDAADPGSEERLLVFDQPYENHNGGGLAFGPIDHMLYIGTGDGGSAGDPLNSGQTTSTLLGKMLRIDTESGTSPYAIPTDNPFRNRTGYRPEIWALGLRNPWRFAFDRKTGDLWIADVGQSSREEVDFQPATSRGGENYGWHIMEGSRCYSPSSGCSTAGLTLPVFEYGHDQGISITGGYLYRGALLPSWQGVYFAADYGSGRLWGIRRDGANRLLLSLSNTFLITTFGEDESGEIYLSRYNRGEIYKFVDTTPAVTKDGVVNAASYRPGIVPGSLVTIFGAGVSGDPGIQQPPATPLPGEWNGSSVYFNDIRAPVYAVANVGGREQINVQVPWEIAALPRVSLTVARGTSRKAPVELEVSRTQPGVFTTDGGRGVIAFNGSGRLVTSQEPAAAGSLLVIYSTGLGAVSNTPPSGFATPLDPLATAREDVQVTVGDRSARVSFAGLTPGFVGLIQINIVVPDGLAPGDQIVVVRAGGVEAPPVTLAVR
jgi:uncharacterized protein (TIGR03437 family)